MRQKRLKLLVLAVALLVTLVAVLLVEYAKEYPQPVPRLTKGSRGPNVAEARRSTAQVRQDLREITVDVRSENWVNAQQHLQATRHDWTILVRSTQLTNRHFVEDMTSLEISISQHRKKDSLELVKRMDGLIRLLEAVFKGPARK